MYSPGVVGTAVVGSTVEIIISEKCKQHNKNVFNQHRSGMGLYICIGGIVYYTTTVC